MGCCPAPASAIESSIPPTSTVRRFMPFMLAPAPGQLYMSEPGVVSS